jgi:hypothetical protein
MNGAGRQPRSPSLVSLWFGARLARSLGTLAALLAALSPVLAAVPLSGCRGHVPVPDARNLIIPTGVAAGALTVENRLPDLVCYVYITQETDRWGEDRLAPAEAIDPDSSRHFEVGAGTWRVRIEDCSRRGVYQRDAVVVQPNGTAIRLLFRE